MFRSLTSILMAAKPAERLPIFSILALFLFAAKAFPADVTLAWDANSEQNLGGYRLHWGQQSRDYKDSLAVGNVTTYAVTGLQDETSYYFAVTAYDITQTLEALIRMRSAIPHSLP